MTIDDFTHETFLNGEETFEGHGWSIGLVPPDLADSGWFWDVRPIDWKVPDIWDKRMEEEVRIQRLADYRKFHCEGSSFRVFATTTSREQAIADALWVVESMT